MDGNISENIIVFVASKTRDTVCRIFDYDKFVFVGIFAEAAFVANYTESMLHNDSLGFAFTKLVVWFACAENAFIDVVINRGEAGDEDRIYSGNAGIGRSNNFAGAEFVADCLEDEGHAKAGLEAKMPILSFCIR